MLRRMYDWCVAAAYRPAAKWIMGSVSFAESSFFPIPPDALLVPMIIADPRRAWYYALVATVASVAGGFLGYAIGFYAFDTIGEPLLRFYGVTEQYLSLQHLDDRWGAWLIVIKGATPIPYKLVTIASGAFHFDFLTFTVASVISRGIRFFLIAALLWQFGEPIRDFIEKRLTLVFSVSVAALVGGFLVVGMVR